jgi:hypothetical protein
MVSAPDSRKLKPMETGWPIRRSNGGDVGDHELNGGCESQCNAG